MNAAIKFFTVFVLACSLAGIGGYAFITLYTQSAEEVVLPELTGKNIIYVLETLTRLGLNAKLMGSRYDRDIPEYGITFQDPAPGTLIKKGRDVVIYISKGSEKALVPDLRQMPLDQARLCLEKAGFIPGTISYVHARETARDHIISQDPPPFSNLSKLGACSLLVGKGPGAEARIMPDLQNMERDRAQSFLAGLNIKSAISIETVSDTAPGLVLSHDPAYGYPVFPGQTVYIKVSAPRPENADRHGVIRVTHSLGFGFLKKHVKVEMDMMGMDLCLYDEYIQAGKDITLLIPEGIHTNIRIFVDNQLVKTTRVDPWHQVTQACCLPWGRGWFSDTGETQWD